MRGSIVRRRDRYYVVTDIPPGPDGKRRQKWHAGYPTRREAEQQLRKVLCEPDAGRWVEPSDRTVGASLLEDWVPAMATTVRPATLRIYRQSITAYVLSAHAGEVGGDGVSGVPLRYDMARANLVRDAARRLPDHMRAGSSAQTADLWYRIPYKRESCCGHHRERSAQEPVPAHRTGQR